MIFGNHDERIKYYELMLEGSLENIPRHGLPEGYRFAMYKAGDERHWIDIEISAKELRDEVQGGEVWEKYYGGHESELPQRMVFIENERGEKIATATAYYDVFGRDKSGDGWLHWVAVRRDEQGRGLSKPLIARTLEIMRGLGYSRAKIPTQTTTWLACKIYLDFGFLPVPENAVRSRAGWEIVNALTGHPALAGFRKAEMREITETRLLLFDLDGTLLRNDKTLSEHTLKILSECRKQGYLIGISTSRGEQNCLKFIGELNPDVIISSGGALARVKGEIILTSSFSAAETKRFIETARKICGADCEITVDTPDTHYWNYKIDPREQDKSWGGSVYTDFNGFERAALKICVEIPDTSAAQTLRGCFPELDCQRFSDGDWYKFTKSGITKEKAISEACGKLNISVSEIIALGDDYSDIGMLKMCGIGVAMGNAIQEVKDAADCITLSNEDDGAADFLKKFLNIKGE